MENAMKTKLSECSLFIAAMCLAAGVEAADVTVDFAAVTGKVKPVHAVGQGPLLGKTNYSLFRHLKEANIPYARLHDVGGAFGGNVFVDIPNIFRDFDADETDPKNYDFTFTDMYLKALVDNGVEPYFRLGVTIETFSRTVKAYRIFPPKDFAKWARICEHVVRHYNEGWARGFKYNIQYWEIWNEADDYPDNRNAMWRGTWKEFCEFYDVAARHLKAKFPHLKIGGYARCTAHSVTYEMKGKPVPEAEAYRHRCFAEFCDFIKARKSPLDFFSFHGYIEADLVKAHVDYHREYLKKAGYGHAELHLNEWMCREWLTNDKTCSYWENPKLSSGIAAFLAAMQIADGLDMAHIYDARCTLSWTSPLFNPVTRKPGKPFYALKSFGTLYALGTAVRCEVAGGQGKDGLWAIAAKNGDKGAVIIVNDSDETRMLEFDFGGWKAKSSCRVTDAGRTDDVAEFTALMLPRSFELVEVNRN